MAKKATPIILELEIIEKYMLQFDKIIIIVDDIESFGKGDYPKKEFLVNFALKNKKSMILEDFLHPTHSVWKVSKPRK